MIYIVLFSMQSRCSRRNHIMQYCHPYYFNDLIISKNQAYRQSLKQLSFFYRCKLFLRKCMNVIVQCPLFSQVNIQNYNIIKSNEKMTLPSFLKTTNITNLLKALTSTYRTSPSPYYLLKMSKNNHLSYYPSLLLLNRSLSNASLQAHPNQFSAWSPHHLHRLQNSGIHNLSSRVVITNPYKSEQLILQALSLSVNQMVINSHEEYQKIQRIKNSSIRFKDRSLLYYWAYCDEPNEMKNLKPLKDVIKNVIFDWTEAGSCSRIDLLTKNILQLGCSLESVICSGHQTDIQQLKRWKLEQFYHENKRLKKKIELKDGSDTENYILAARSKGRGPIGIDTTAQELIQLKNYGENCLMIHVQKEEWLLSKIGKFPLDEQSYLFQMSSKPENKELEIKQASII